MDLKPYFETSNGKLYCCDALELLKQLPTVDAVITDPPYGSNAFTWDRATIELHIRFLEDVHDIMIDGAPIFMFYAPMHLHEILPHFVNLFRLRNIIVWHHPNIYAYGKTYGGDRFKSTWEAILYGIKGEKPRIADANKCLFNNYGRSFDVIVMPAPTKTLHPAQKPEKLIEMLVRCFTKRSDLVLDPFLGSGTTAVVAERLGRRWIGIEKDKRFCEIARERILKSTSISRGWW